MIHDSFKSYRYFVFTKHFCPKKLRTKFSSIIIIHIKSLFQFNVSFISIVLSSKHFESSLQYSCKVVSASVYFLRLGCSFRFRYSLTVLPNIHKPAPKPLATGSTTSLTPILVEVIQLAETASTKTPSTECVV